MWCGFGLLALVALNSLVQFGHGQVHVVQEGVSLIDGFFTQGLVQLSYEGRTGLLCSDGLSRGSLRVVCRDLGLPEQFPSLRPVQQPPGTRFLGTNVTCHGAEIKLADCHHDDWGQGSCPSGEAAYLACKADPCQPSPCENGGTCVSTQTDVGFRCDCPPTWSGLLCTSDVNECHSQNGGCSDVCVNMDGGYSCECPARELQLGPDNHTCSAIGEEVICGADSMVLTFEKVHYQSLHKEHLTLSDVSCRATDNATHIILRAPLTGCGTTSQMIGTTIIYKNVVRSQEEVVDGIISRVKEVEIPFQCVMTLEEGIDVPIAVDTGELHFLLEGTGTHNVDLQFSNNGTFHPGQGVVSVYPGQNIWAKANLHTADPDLVVAISNCSATNSSNHNSTSTPYTIMTKGCAVDSTLFLVNTTDLTEQQFVMEAFKFLDNSPDVIFHCDVELCDRGDEHSFCAQGCANTP